MKNSGPAFIGATMRRSIFCVNGASPFLARPIQFDAMKPKSMSFASSRLAFSTLAWAEVDDLDRRQRRHAVEHGLERKALAQKRTVRLGRADAHACHVIRP